MTQGYGQSFVNNNMIAGNDVFHMNNGGIPMTDQISLQQQRQQQPQQPSGNNAFTPISQANTLLHNLFRGDASSDPSLSFEVEEVSFPEHFYKIQVRQYRVLPIAVECGMNDPKKIYKGWVLRF